MNYPRPGRCFSRHAVKQVPRLRALRELISNLPGASDSSTGAVKQSESSSVDADRGKSIRPGAPARQSFFSMP
jgi:hypothetical protein